jgi:hypothetical protein
VRVEDETFLNGASRYRRVKTGHGPAVDDRK